MKKLCSTDCRTSSNWELTLNWRLHRCSPTRSPPSASVSSFSLPSSLPSSWPSPCTGGGREAGSRTPPKGEKRGPRWIQWRNARLLSLRRRRRQVSLRHSIADCIKCSIVHTNTVNPFTFPLCPPPSLFTRWCASFRVVSTWGCAPIRINGGLTHEA